VSCGARGHPEGRSRCAAGRRGVSRSCMRCLGLPSSMLGFPPCPKFAAGARSRGSAVLVRAARRVVHGRPNGGGSRALTEPAGRQVARRLEAHPRIRRVHYPGLPSHRDHAIAIEQMSGFGGVISFEARPYPKSRWLAAASGVPGVGLGAWCACGRGSRLCRAPRGTCLRSNAPACTAIDTAAARWRQSPTRAPRPRPPGGRRPVGHGAVHRLGAAAVHRAQLGRRGVADRAAHRHLLLGPGAPAAAPAPPQRPPWLRAW